MLFHVQKKSMLELMVFKMLKMTVEKRLKKGVGVLQFIEGKTVDVDQGG